MKLIIDIPEAPLYRDMYTAICENGYIFDEDNEYIAKAIKGGTPIPNNATNGDVIMAMFPNVDFVTDVFGGFNFPKWWWNASYQKGGKE